jgi:hypothetical protein
MSGGADACWGASRPRPSLVLPLKTALGVAGSPGGRSWKRRQELVSLHSSALQRKLSSTASLDGLSCHSAGRATRAAASKMRPAAAADRGHLPNGVPSLRPPGSTLAGSTSGADSEEAAGAPPARSPKQRRLSRQQQEVETGNNNAALPKPDLSGVACVGAAASAASQEKQEKGSVQQQQGSKSSRQESSAAGTSDSDSAGTGLFAASGKSCVTPQFHLLPPIHLLFQAVMVAPATGCGARRYVFLLPVCLRSCINAQARCRQPGTTICLGWAVSSS